MIKYSTQIIAAFIMILTLSACDYEQSEVEVTGKWIQKNGESSLEFTNEGGYIIKFKPSLSDGTTDFSGESYKKTDISHLNFTIMMGRAEFRIIEVEATIKRNKELHFNLDGKKYRFIKEKTNPK